MRDAGHRTPDTGRRTAEKAKIIYPPPRGVDIITSLSRKEPQPAGTTKWPATLRFGKILGTTLVVRSIQNPRNGVRCTIHRP